MRARKSFAKKKSCNNPTTPLTSFAIRVISLDRQILSTLFRHEKILGPTNEMQFEHRNNLFTDAILLLQSVQTENDLSCHENILRPGSDAELFMSRA